MKRLINWKFLVSAIAALTVLIGCNTYWKSETGNPSYAHRVSWKKYLKVHNADPNKPIGTTMTHIGNVSHRMAVAKMNQALQSYSDDLGYKLSSVFELTTTDEAEKSISSKDSDKDNDNKTDHGEPAVAAMVVQGHLYYIGALDYRTDTDTLTEYDQTKRQIPAIAVVDGEDASKPGWIRTRDEDGNPYKIVLRYSQITAYDDNNIYRHLRNRGFSRWNGCHHIDNPTLEVDDKWKPYYTVTWNVDDACLGSNGTMYWPEQLIILDAQTTDEKGMQVYNLDNPNTPDKNERDPKIPAWVDQVYSPQIAMEYIKAWGYNPDNYGKTSHLNDFTVDGNHLDEVMNAANTNIVFVAYITSLNIDDSLIGVMLFDPQDGTAEYYETQGIHAMATKTSAVNAIKQATHRWDYNVEDLTLHTIYGVPTWQGELTRPAVDDDGKEYGSLYCGMVMLQANYDHQPQHVRWGFSKQEVFTEYERWVIQSRTRRVGSNVAEIKELELTVDNIDNVVINGNTDYIIKGREHPGAFAVRVEYIGDPNTEEVLAVRPGQRVFMKYADPVNTHTYLVLEIHNLTQPPAAETHANEHFESLPKK